MLRCLMHRWWNWSERQTQRKGYTLIEMITVSSILGILVAMAIASVTKARVSAREAKALATVKGVINAYTTYLVRYGEYPHYGPGMRYANVTELWNDLGAKGYFPQPWMYYQPQPSTGLIKGPLDGYLIDIHPYVQDAGQMRDTANYFEIILRPYGFQTGYIGITVDPANDHPTPVPLHGQNLDITTYSLYRNYE